MKLLLDMIQPSQLYINKRKLKKIHQIIETEGIEALDPIPIKELNHEMVSTDGHTRMFALHQLGIEDVDIVWETDELDWEVYQRCVDWCHDNGIWAIRHLEGRIVNNDEYQRLWIERCQNLKLEIQGQRDG